MHYDFTSLNSDPREPGMEGKKVSRNSRKLLSDPSIWKPIELPGLGLSREDSKAYLAEEIFSPLESADLFDDLQDGLVWEEREIQIFGRRMLQPRLVSFYGDPGAAYRYSGGLFSPRPWTVVLDTVRRHVESLVGCSFNAVLCNLYRTGADSMGWHSDDEAEMGERPVIASVSLGATRRLRFRARDPENRTGSRGIDLRAGSLLLMTGAMQQLYQHQVPKVTASVGVEPRINLTFRKIEHPGARSVPLKRSVKL